jgi:hypothetical protein
VRELICETFQNTPKYAGFLSQLKLRTRAPIARALTLETTAQTGFPLTDAAKRSRSGAQQKGEMAVTNRHIFPIQLGLSLR